MTLRLRLLLGAPLAVLTAVVLSACGTTDGLDAGEPAPPVSVQPSPKPLWPDWSGTTPSAPGAETATKLPPPEPLDGIGELGPRGLAGLDVRELLRADPRIKTLADRPMIKKPGRSGIRPPVLVDLSGDGKPELLLAIDLESGRSAVVVYAERGGKVYPVLFTAGKRISVEVIGTDLLVRSPCADGGEQAVRYHWDGKRMSTVSDTKNYKKPDRSPDHGDGDHSDSDHGDHGDGGPASPTASARPGTRS
ncbi:hypothetical protein [Streptomyces sp. NRRL B-1347]|uniref:hypothetical protein n=1 Tax=Streptomyces sp. NRRL B-1347 TaxID=1476877 RepID=UPI000B214460|nr:hypothetical protein [Streptomyces sp. NRRL B-1347]